MEITLRMASPADAEKMLAIYAPYVENTSITFEYVPPTVEEFTRRVERILPQYPWLVCEVDGEIAGYCYASAHHERAAVSGTQSFRSMWTTVSTGWALRPGCMGPLQHCWPLKAITGCIPLITVPNPVSVGFHQAPRLFHHCHLSRHRLQAGRVARHECHGTSPA